MVSTFHNIYNYSSYYLQVLSHADTVFNTVKYIFRMIYGEL